MHILPEPGSLEAHDLETHGPDVDSSLEQALRTLLDTWQQGRKVLIVLGAGVSVEANIPLMTSVYANLRQRLGDPDLGSSFLIDELRRDLSALERGQGSRSLAAMSLGTLQKAHATTKKAGDLQERLARLWDSFSEDFIAGRVPGSKVDGEQHFLSSRERSSVVEMIRSHPFANDLRRVLKPPDEAKKPTEEIQPLHLRLPTKFHYLVARWIAEDWATVVSVNFDGLTRRALGDVLAEKAKDGDQPAAVVLTEPRALRNFVFGSKSTNVPTAAVIKVWGDVFHAVCTNSRCPEAGIRVPIFQLPVLRNGESGIATQSGEVVHECPSCRQRRQLQIFFTGYEEKEVLTRELLEEMLRTVAPQIGCVLTVGFSGLWDQALVRFIVSLSELISRENDATNRKAASCICVDPDENPVLQQDLESQAVTACYVRATAEELASIFEIPVADLRTNEIPELRSFSDEDGLLTDGLWYGGKESEFGKTVLAQALPATYDHLRTEGYLKQATQLRQLGIKTKISIAMHGTQHSGLDEGDHNRRMHSRGAAHLAALWFRKLSKPLAVSDSLRERLCSVAVFSAMHHDLGHLPFTHLTEEIFDELHWTLSDWAMPFKHDDPVLAEPFEGYSVLLNEAIMKTAEQLNLSETQLRHWAECAIQGRSGYPWMDAILNSPLDVDKLDYVFRDCRFLNQQLHIPQKNTAGWIQQLFEHSVVLPSGMVALDGIAGTHARDFLEERWWLYRRQYLRPGFRAVERIARAVIIQWLLNRVRSASDVMTTPRSPMRDPSAIKGRQARRVLWERLTKMENDQHGEPDLLRAMANEIGETPGKGLPQSARVKAWAKQCDRVFEKSFAEPPSANDATSLLDYLRKEVGITCSESAYIKSADLPTVREIARNLETTRPFRALVDIAIFPRMLAYPARRSLEWGDVSVTGECFAVSHRDPDRWGTSSNRWIPLSESAFAERDKHRWAKITVVSPYPEDPEVWHMLDRFRNECRQRDLEVTDLDPEKATSL